MFAAAIATLKFASGEVLSVHQAGLQATATECPAERSGKINLFHQGDGQRGELDDFTGHRAQQCPERQASTMATDDDALTLQFVSRSDYMHARRTDAGM